MRKVLKWIGVGVGGLVALALLAALGLAARGYARVPPTYAASALLAPVRTVPPPLATRHPLDHDPRLLVLACLQDLSQARSRWGYAADGFLTLFPTKVVLPGIADLATLNTISAIAGEIEIPRTTTTRPTLFSGGRGSKSVHLERRPAGEPAPEIEASARIGIAFAGPDWVNQPCRFTIAGNPSLSR